MEIKLSADEIPVLTIGDSEVRSVYALNARTRDWGSLVDRLSKFSSWSLVTQAFARILWCLSKNGSNSLTNVRHNQGTAERCVSRSVETAKQRNPLTISQSITLSWYLSWHPAIIAKDNRIMKLIQAYPQGRMKHQGKGLNINEIRSNGYWIPGINRAVAA